MISQLPARTERIGPLARPSLAQRRTPEPHSRSRNRSVLFQAAAVLVCAGVVSMSLLAAESEKYTDDEMKLAQLYNIIPFVEWPAAAFDSVSSPLVLGVLGKDPFRAGLEEVFTDRSVNGRKFEIKRSENLRDLLPCHILFIASSEKARASQIVQTVADTPTLTVSDIAGFPEVNGILYFVVENDHVAFEINRPAANRASLKFRAQLLRLARKLHGTPPN